MSGSSKFRRLTSRQADMIRILIQSGTQPITISEVADRLGVSSRTVLRELPDIERWFKENDISFVRKPSVGLSLQEDEQKLVSLQAMIDSEKVQPGYSRKERRRQILGELLLAKEPVKSYAFVSRFQISEGTLSSDLDALAKWLSTYRIQVIRRPGLGIRLEGTETDYRQAIAGAAFEFLDEGEILNLLRSAKEDKPSPDVPPANDQLFSFMETETVSFIERILRDTEKQLGIQYTDSGYMGLMVHLSLAIQRLQTEERIELDEEELTQLKALPEFSVALRIAEKIEKQFGLTVPEAEAGFITVHLRSARIWRNKSSTQLQSVNARELVAALVESVERQVGLPFHTSSRLMDDLTSHMDMLINRLTVGRKIDTMQNATQTEMLRQNYPEIYRAIEKNKAMLKSRLATDSFPPSEITFLAMHFAAAAELLRAEQMKVAVAVVCPSGMGASRMLAANLMRSCPDVEVRQIASAFRLNPGQLREGHIDLVISTVPINIDFPAVCVSPIPCEKDMLKIMQAVESVNMNRKPLKAGEVAEGKRLSRIGRDGIESLTRLGTEICQLLDHFTIHETSGISRVEELIGCAAGMFADSITSRQNISSELARRETVKSTFLPEMKVYLLHCRTIGVQHCRFGYIRLLEPIGITSGTVEGAVLMLAPKVDWDEGIEVISRMSTLLVEEKRFLEALKRGDEKKGGKLAEEALVKYYESEIRRKTGESKL